MPNSTHGLGSKMESLLPATDIALPNGISYLLRPLHREGHLREQLPKPLAPSLKQLFTLHVCQLLPLRLHYPYSESETVARADKFQDREH